MPQSTMLTMYASILTNYSATSIIQNQMGPGKKIQMIKSSDNHGYLLPYAFMHGRPEAKCLDNQGIRITKAAL